MTRSDIRSDLPFANAFPLSDEAAWRTRVDAVLKGKPFESLVAKTADGIAIAPLYPAAMPSPQPTRAHAGPWGVLARVDDAGPDQAHSQALDDLGGGADGLQLVMAGGLGAYGFGLANTQPAIDHALADVVFDAEIPVELDSLDGGQAALALAACLAERKTDIAATRISFGIDRFGGIARGNGADWAAARTDFAAACKDLAARGFTGPFAVADARVIHAAGGSEAQELGYALSAALAGLRALEDAGVPLEVARKWVSFRIAADADEFLGVAKLRALRRLWASIEEQCGLRPAPAHIHAETAWRMMTRRDPDVNMLRATLAIFAASVGGADRITVLPHTQAIGLPDAFARRVARNSQLVLIAEAHLDKVADPAAGSGGFEALTKALCEKGWDCFSQTEKEGGLAKALQSGRLESDVAATAAARAKNIATRRDALTGVSEFPAINETRPSVLAALDESVLAAGPFAPMRLSAPFEAFRDKSDEALAKTGSRPKIFLANLGPLAAYAARAGYAKNLFEAGGIAPVDFESADAAGDLGAAFKASGASIACLCSSDAIYAERAEEAARALAAAGAKRVFFAGRPGEAKGRYEAAGVTDFVFAGSDTLEALGKAWGAVG